MPLSRQHRKSSAISNFSSGASDPKFLWCLNHLFGLLEEQPEKGEPTWQALGHVLRRTLADLHGRSEAFRQVDQAQAVLDLVFDSVLPGYRAIPCRPAVPPDRRGPVPAVLRGPGLRGGACRRAARGTGRTASPACDRTVERLPRAIGRWPCSAPSRRSSPTPTNGCGRSRSGFAGRAWPSGRYHDLIEQALAILEATDPSLLFEAMFDPDLLDELAVDPRAYDFDHPANKRPNYLFGQWDMGKLDNSGRCRRFVVQQVSLGRHAATASSTAASCPTRRSCSRRRPCWPARC